MSRVPLHAVQVGAVEAKLRRMSPLMGPNFGSMSKRRAMPKTAFSGTASISMLDLTATRMWPLVAAIHSPMRFGLFAQDAKLQAIFSIHSSERVGVVTWPPE